MGARAAKPGNADATRGLALAVAGTLLVPIVLVAVALTPESARGWVFEIGCVAAAGMALWGGACARRALSEGTDHTAVAVVASLLGLVVGITIAVLAFWSLIGLLS